MRIALFGGSFDPPHRGHVALARLAVNRLHLDRVLVAPVGRQPLKHDATSASFEDRIAMVQLAFADEPHIEISRADAPRSDDRPNYTIDAILNLKRTMDDRGVLFFIMGADSWLTIGKWYRAAGLLMECDFIVGARPGFDLGQIPKALPPEIRVGGEHSDVSGCRLWQLSNLSGRHTRLYLLPDLAEDVSATEVRVALSHHAETHAGPEAVLAPEVASYIRAHRLYGVDI
jgi:nicotinate-nucleotide adenylyltransferase